MTVDEHLQAQWGLLCLFRISFPRNVIHGRKAIIESKTKEQRGKSQEKRGWTEERDKSEGRSKCDRSRPQAHLRHLLKQTEMLNTAILAHCCEVILNSGLICIYLMINDVENFSYICWQCVRFPMTDVSLGLLPVFQVICFMPTEHSVFLLYSRY